jgi:DNA repair exonuclease SbcCD ATPase subunit
VSALPFTERWRLERVAIRHFRGVARERTYAFDGRAGLLYGENGVGKSTVALALQWILYGRFPDGVLPNTSYNQFLAPVQAKGAAWSGEVVLARGREQLVVARDAATKSFVVQTDGDTCTGADAEARRDALLGLDADTFPRAVLLQQSRIRGLLLDDPKERNRALDRLLGMDALEHLLEVAKTKPFTDAAVEWRSKIRQEQQEHESREKLLVSQLNDAQALARGLKFLNKDLNPSGLKARYAELGRDVAALARKCGVAAVELSACETPRDADKVSKAFTKAVQAIRVGSELQKRLVPVTKRLGDLGARQERWGEAWERLEKTRASLAELVAKHGENKDLEAELATCKEGVQQLARERKAADGLRALLHDALAVMRRDAARECPVCEQRLPAGLDLPARLKTRVAALASEELDGLGAAIEKQEKRFERLRDIVASHGERAAEVEAAQRQLDKQRQAALDALGGAGIAEPKVAARLAEAIAELERERKTLAKGMEVMEGELEAIDLRERNVTQGLLAAVRKRDELERHEAAAKKLADAHARDEAKAQEMEAHAAQVEAIRKALLDAKKDLAGDSLKRAGPRAQQLYRALVRQPVFDTLDIEATPKANKVDYAFQVSRAGASTTARDARLVLSDGQLTATALALFFGLAESTAHGLDLLYVDDPTQNLDLKTKAAMAKVVTDLAKRRQVVVSTQDEDFVSFLETEGFPKEAVVHHITAWDGDPRVETSSP